MCESDSFEQESTDGISEQVDALLQLHGQF